MFFGERLSLKSTLKRILSVVISASFVATASMPLSIMKVSAADTPAQSIFTDYQPVVTETIDANGFTHPSVGLTKELLENVRSEVRGKKEPWNSYFNAMMVSSAASQTAPSSNQVSDTSTTPAVTVFNSQSVEKKFIEDGLKSYTQALLYFITGNEVYRTNAMHIIRIWSHMDNTKYTYYTDACIHTGVPLNRMVTAAEILRYTSCNTQALQWTDQDTTDFTNNLINPVINTFQHDPNHFMNQHLYPLMGALAGYIFTGNRAGYNEATEWFTVNKEAKDQGYNGSVKQLFRWIDKEDVIGQKVTDGKPVPGHVQHIEMGRDQAHGGGDLTNTAIICRLLLAQGTKLDPDKGTVSTADNAVGPYEFLNDRILGAANYFWQWMLGYDTPWTPVAYSIAADGTVRDTYNFISPSYRGRFNTTNFWDMYSYYTYVRHINLAEKAPYFYEAFKKKLPSNYYYGGSLNINWDNVDGGGDYWLYLPKEAEKDSAMFMPKEQTNPNLVEVEDRCTRFDDNSSVMQEGDVSFVRLNATSSGCKISVLGASTGSKTIGFKIRTNGMAKLEMKPGINDTITLPDTKGNWTYVTYTMGQLQSLGDIVYLTVKGSGTKVDIDNININAGAQLTPPAFKSGNSDINIYTYSGQTVNVDFSATDSNIKDVISYNATDLPDGAVLDAATGAFTWKTSQPGTNTFAVCASDGTSTVVKNVNIVISSDRASAVQSVIAPYNKDAIYVQDSLNKFKTVYNDTVNKINTASDEDFNKQLLNLRSAVENLKLVTPTLSSDGSMDYPDIVSSSTFSTSIANLVDNDPGTFAAYGLAPALYHILDFGPDYKISATAFGFQSNIFADRIAGSIVFGSNDGQTWTRLTPEETAFTQSFQTLQVEDSLKNAKFRYIKIQLIDLKPDIIHDSVQNLMEISEFRIYGQRYEIGNKLESVSIGSAQSVKGKVSTGSMVTLSIKAKEPIKNVKVKIQGQDANVITQDNVNWAAITTLNSDVPKGMVKFTIDYQRNDGTDADTTYSTTDNSQLYIIDKTKLIDVSKLAKVTASDAQWPGTGLQSDQVGYLLFDGDTNTFGDLNTPAGSNSYYTIDFGANVAIKLSQIMLMPRTGKSSRMNGLIIQGSNDNTNWTAITLPVKGSQDNIWSDIESDSMLNHNSYRYLRLFNSSAWNGDVAEVELYGDYDVSNIDSLILPADGYTKASYYLYKKEADRIKAAINQPGADKAELMKELTNAQGQLVIAGTSAMGDRINVTKSMVNASTVQWHASGTPQDNGWRGFDGDINTSPDATKNPSWVLVDFGQNNQQNIGSVMFYPRSDSADHINRMNGAIIQGSDDGTNFTNLYTISNVKAAQWYTIPINSSKAYRFFRYYTTTGGANFGEIQLYQPTKDTTLLSLLIKNAAELNLNQYSEASKNALNLAATVAQSVYLNSGVTQNDIDKAASDLDFALNNMKYSEDIPVICPIDDKFIVAENPLSFKIETANSVNYAVYSSVYSSVYSTVYSSVYSTVYSAVYMPEGAIFDANTHTFAWTPSRYQGGKYTVTFIAASNGKTFERKVNITVKGQPAIDPDTSATITARQPFTYNVKASDPIDSPLCYLGSNLPSGSAFDAASGIFTWTPSQADFGEHIITFTANNGSFSVNQKITINVQLSKYLPEAYTRGSYYQYSKAETQIEASMKQAGSDKAELADELLKAEGQLVSISTLPADPINITQSMVNASTNQWPGTGTTQANGWRAFDGDINTATDATANPSWIVADFGENNNQIIGSVKFYPRGDSNDHIQRVNGAVLQGSVDGTNFVDLYTISNINSAQWYTVPVTNNTAFRYFRYYSPKGGANVAELQLYQTPKDKTLLNLLLSKAAAINPDQYTKDTRNAFSTAMTAASTVASDVYALQTAIDTASLNLDAAISGLVALPLNVPVTSVKVSSNTSSITSGNTLQMNAEVLPLDATNKAVTWSVSVKNGSFTSCSITSEGLLSASGSGTLTVTATVYGGITGTEDIIVNSPIVPTPTPTPTPIPTPAPAQTTPTVTGETKNNQDPSKDKNSQPTFDTALSTATISIDKTVLDNVFKKSDIAVIDVPQVEGAKTYALSIPASELASGDKTKSVKMVSQAGALQIPLNMLSDSDILSGSGDSPTLNVSLTMGKADSSKLSDAERAIIGNKPVVEIGLKVNGKEIPWNNPEAPVKVTIPYTPSAAELKDTEHITVFSIGSDGKMTAIPTAKYDMRTGTISFRTTHFSEYGVAYVNKTFDDIDGCQWAQKAIEVMASKGVINGTASDKFTPGNDIKRADLMVLLVRALGLTAKTDGNFSDVNPNAYYAEALAVAKKLGIATGVGNNKFNPDSKITRQDAMALIYRAMKAADIKLLEGTEKGLSRFSDKNSVASYAINCAATLVDNGIVTGDKGKINPFGSATRAEVAVMIYRMYNK